MPSSNFPTQFRSSNLTLNSSPWTSYPCYNSLLSNNGLDAIDISSDASEYARRFDTLKFQKE